MTDDEIKALALKHSSDNVAFARAVIAQRDAELMAGSGEPEAHFHYHQYGNTLLREQVSPEYKDAEGVFPLYTADQLKAAVLRYKQDAERLDWIERKLFVRTWNGVIDSGSNTRWRIAEGDWRRLAATLNGDTFREAIDAAIRQGGE